jgi:hypothetical protein
LNKFRHQINCIVVSTETLSLNWGKQYDAWLSRPRWCIASCNMRGYIAGVASTMLTHSKATAGEERHKQLWEMNSGRAKGVVNSWIARGTLYGWH